MIGPVIITPTTSQTTLQTRVLSAVAGTLATHLRPGVLRQGAGVAKKRKQLWHAKHSVRAAWSCKIVCFISSRTRSVKGGATAKLFKLNNQLRARKRGAERGIRRRSPFKRRSQTTKTPIKKMKLKTWLLSGSALRLSDSLGLNETKKRLSIPWVNYGLRNKKR